MKILLSLVAVAGLFTPALFAQNIAPTLLSTGGDYFQIPGQGSLHWTLGEPAVESFEGLTLGFLQGDPATVSTGETGPEALVRVFPNPVSGWLVCEKNTDQALRIHLTDAIGRPVLSTELIDFQTKIDLSALPNGAYFLQIIAGNSLLLTDLIIKI